MSFHETAQGIYIENQGGITVLFAEIQDAYGEWVQTSLILDEILGNEDGCFVWGGGAFTETAQDLEFFQDEFGVPYLRASLLNAQEEWVSYELNLAERIANVDGCLILI